MESKRRTKHSKAGRLASTAEEIGGKALEKRGRGKSGRTREAIESELRRPHDNESVESRAGGCAPELFELNRALQASERRFRSLATFSPIGIFLNDATGNCIYANERCLEIFGMTAEQILGVGWSAGVHPDDRVGVFARWQHARGAAIEATDEFRVLRSDGDMRHVRTHVRPIAVEGQPPSEFVGCVEDVTERKRAEDAAIAARTEAERAHEAKSRFLAAVSHDLAQPLAALELYVGMLEHRVGADLEPLLANMKACVASLDGLFTDLLDLSKLEARVVTPNVSDFAVDDIIARVLAAHAPAAQLKGLSLRFRSCDVTARTDPVLYGRIIGNLVSNAVRYTERGGVLVGCRRRGASRWIEVWDTGIGIPNEMVGAIFEEFRQLASGQQRICGSGLGLAIVVRTAALLGLRIRLRSREGKGSLFAVELPLGGVAKGQVHRAPLN